jgi:hypothetical protein
MIGELFGWNGRVFSNRKIDQDLRETLSLIIMMKTDRFWISDEFDLSILNDLRDLWNEIEHNPSLFPLNQRLLTLTYHSPGKLGIVLSVQMHGVENY